MINTDTIRITPAFLNLIAGIDMYRQIWLAAERHSLWTAPSGIMVGSC